MRASFLFGILTGVAVSASTAIAGGRLDDAWALVGAAEAETAALRGLVDQVPHPSLRRAMRDHLGALDAQLDAMGALVASTPVRPPPPPPPPPVLLAPPVPSEAEMASLLRAVEQAGFSDERVALIGGMARDRSFTVAQVRRFVEAVPFADAKVDVAAMLYPHVVDAWMWHEVYADIPFSSSREELRQRTR